MQGMNNKERTSPLLPIRGVSAQPHTDTHLASLLKFHQSTKHKAGHPGKATAGKVCKFVISTFWVLSQPFRTSSFRNQALIMLFFVSVFVFCASFFLPNKDNSL